MEKSGRTQQEKGGEAVKKFFARLVSANHIWTPKGLVTRALVGVIAYFIFSLLGLRQYTTILSGTSPSGHGISSIDIMLMGIYVFSYLYATIAAPALCIAAGLLYCANKLAGKKVSRKTENPET
jgi:hypothetical protein